MQTEETDVIVLLRDMINGVERRLTSRLDKQDETLYAIHSEARLTNGRVTTIENRRRSVIRFLTWAVPTLIAAAGTVPLWLPVVS